MNEVSSVWITWVVVGNPSVDLSDILTFSENMEKLCQKLAAVGYW
jgi:hypothetical protein